MPSCRTLGFQSGERYRIIRSAPGVMSPVMTSTRPSPAKSAGTTRCVWNPLTMTCLIQPAGAGVCAVPQNPQHPSAANRTGDGLIHFARFCGNAYTSIQSVRDDAELLAPGG